MYTLENRKYFADIEEGELEKCESVIDTCVELCTYSRKYGLIALDKIIRNYGDDFLILGIELLTNGMDGKTIKSIMEPYIVSSFKTGHELLEMIIMLDAILSINDGLNPWFLRIKLNGYIGKYDLKESDFMNKKIERNTMVEVNES